MHSLTLDSLSALFSSIFDTSVSVPSTSFLGLEAPNEQALGCGSGLIRANIDPTSGRFLGVLSQHGRFPTLVGVSDDTDEPAGEMPEPGSLAEAQDPVASMVESVQDSGVPPPKNIDSDLVSGPLIAQGF